MNKFAAHNPKRDFSEAQLNNVQEAIAARTAAKQLATGPISEEGKHTSSLNARKHGFAGAQLVIDEEDRPAYDLHLESYVQAFQPANQPEADAVRLAANALWRVDRLTSIETALFELETAFYRPFNDANLDNLEPRHLQAIAFMQHVDGSNALELARRYLSSTQRDLQRALDIFFKLKENRVAVIPVANPTKLHIVPRPPNELSPIPVSDHLELPQPAVNPSQTLKPPLKRTSRRRRNRK